MTVDRVEAYIVAAHNPHTQEWNGYVQMKIGHICDCGGCQRNTGMLLKGAISAAPSRREARHRAMDIVGQFLSSSLGRPMIWEEYDDGTVVYTQGDIAFEDVVSDDFEEEEDEEYEEEDQRRETHPPTSHKGKRAYPPTPPQATGKSRFVRGVGGHPVRQRH